MSHIHNEQQIGFWNLLTYVPLWYVLLEMYREKQPYI